LRDTWRSGAQPENFVHAAPWYGTDELSPPAQAEIGPPRPVLGQP
jgi:hypothetical protein